MANEVRTFVGSNESWHACQHDVPLHMFPPYSPHTQQFLQTVSSTVLTDWADVCTYTTRVHKFGRSIPGWPFVQLVPTGASFAWPLNNFARKMASGQL